MRHRLITSILQSKRVHKVDATNFRPRRFALTHAVHIEGINAAGLGISQTDPFPSLGPVLHLTIAEGPILAARVDEIDPHVLLAHASLRMDLVGDLMEEFLLHLS